MILGGDMKTIHFTADGDADEWTKRQIYVQRYKENVWKRWKHECLLALRERHNLSYKDGTRKVNIADIVIIKGEVIDVIGRSVRYPNCILKRQVVRAVQMQVGIKFLVQPIQLLYPLELHCSSQRGDRTR